MLEYDKKFGTPSYRLPIYPDVKQRLDFKALGYPDDAALVGGRFYVALGKGQPPR